MDVELFGQSVAFWVAVAVVGVVGTARLTRLLVHDSFPPVAWLRSRWDAATEDSGWGVLLHCHHCAAPWLGAITIAWAWASDFHWSWWAFYGFLTVAYLASILVSWDEPPDADE